MKKDQKIDEKYLFAHFKEIQELITEWKEKYSISIELPSVEPEDQKPSITQPFYTYQIHAVG